MTNQELIDTYISTVRVGMNSRSDILAPDDTYFICQHEALELADELEKRGIPLPDIVQESRPCMYVQENATPDYEIPF